MTHSSLLLVIYAACVYRLSRLVAVDAFFAPLRDWLRERGFKDMTKTDYMGSVVAKTTFYRNRAFAFVFNLLTCMWCNSIWLGGIVVTLGYFYSSVMQYVCAAFALSAFTGVVSEKL